MELQGPVPTCSSGESNLVPVIVARDSAVDSMSARRNIGMIAPVAAATCTTDGSSKLEINKTEGNVYQNGMQGGTILNPQVLILISTKEVVGYMHMLIVPY